MKAKLPKILLVIVLFAVTTMINAQTYLGKDMSTYQVWKELLKQEKVHFQSVVDAYEVYASNNEVKKEDRKDFHFWKQQYENQLDANGYVISHAEVFNNLQQYSRPSPNMEKEVEILPAKSTIGMTFAANVPNASSDGDWVNIGPFGDPDVKWSATGNGALEMVAFHPTDPATMYVPARNGGIWKTTNYGKNWVPLTDHLPDPYTRYIDIAKSNPNVLYVAAGNGDTKMWLSTDAGTSWTNISAGLAGNVYEVFAHPTDAARAIAMTIEDGIYGTTNYGASWTQLRTGTFNNLILSEDRGILYAFDKSSTDPNIIKSIDFGATWTTHPVTTDIAAVQHLHIALHEDGINVPQVFIYAIQSGAVSGYPTRFAGLWKSTDGAASFTKIQNPGYAYPNGPVPLRKTTLAPLADGYGGINPFHITTWASTFYVSAANPDHMITQAAKMWGSDDGGESWEFKPSYGESNWADMRFMNHNIAKDTLYFINDGGIFSIAEKDLFPDDADVPAGQTRLQYMSTKVQYKNGDICVVEGNQFGVSQYTKDVYTHGGQDVGQIFHRSGRTTHIASSDVYRGNIKPTNDSLYYTGRLNITIGGLAASLYNDITPDHFNPLRLYGYSVDAPVRLIRSLEGIDAWDVNGFRGENRAYTGGRSWVSSHPTGWEFLAVDGTGIANYYEGMFEQSRANKELAFIGDRNAKKMFMTNNLSAASPTWIELPNAPQLDQYFIATHPLNEDLVVIASNTSVYVSKDKGNRWETYGNFPTGVGNVFQILIDKNTSQGVYALTKSTVFYMDETLPNWITFEKGLPRLQNQDMELVHLPNGDNVLYIGKYGRGMWRSPTYQQVKEDLPIANFDMFGGYERTIIANEATKLYNLSTNATSVSWQLVNGSDIINVSNQDTPEITLTQSGFYTVTITATNANGSDTLTKELYIEVLPEPHNVCTPGAGDNTWYRKFDYFDFNGDKKTLPGAPHYKKLDWVLELNQGQQVNFDINTWDGNTWYYTKGWIDYNDDGVFDDPGEEVLSSNGQVNNSFTGSFTISNAALLNRRLNFRIAGHVSTTAPTPCLNSGSQYQVVDLQIKINNLPIFSNLTDAAVTQNSADLSVAYTNAQNVTQSGFIFSPIAPIPDMNNGVKISSTNTLGNADNFGLNANELLPNTTYYYRAFIIDEFGIHYSAEILQFTTTPYAMPLLELSSPVQLASDNWQLSGRIQPENNTLSSLIIEYGVDDTFNQSITLDHTQFAGDQWFDVSELINFDPLNPVYLVRIGTVVNGKTYYSNTIEINTSQTICNPVIGSTQWWRWIKEFSFDGNLTTVPDRTSYHDYTATIFEAEALKSYPFYMLDNYTGASYYYFRLYIDYNNDNDFNDTGEEVINSATADRYDGTLTIPAIVAENQVVRMRVYYGENGGNECNTNSAQVLDFGLRLLPFTKANLNISNITVDENVGNAVVEVTLDTATPSGFTVDYATTDGLAIAGNDYTVASGTLIFAGTANEKQTISIPITEDSLNEITETINVTLSNLSNTQIVEIPVTDIVVEINDNDPTSISVLDANIDETAGIASVKVVLNGDTASGFDVDFTTVDDVAIQPNDYTIASGTLSFIGNKDEEQLITVSIINDTDVEGAESFKINISNITSLSATISDAEGIVTITDDETANLSIDDVTIQEDAGNAIFTVTLGDNVPGGFMVDYITTNYTAMVNEDFSLRTGTLTFIGNKDEKQTITVPILNDAAVEASETFEVTLSNLNSGLVSISKSIGTGTITNDDTSNISITDITVDEDAGNAIFTAILTGGVSGGFKVSCRTGDDSAIETEDYTETTERLTFSGTIGERQTFSVPLLDDNSVEGAERFSATLYNISNALVGISNATAYANINDNDTASLSVNDIQVNESDATAVFTVTLTGEVVGGFTVDIATSTQGTGFIAANTTLNFSGTDGETQMFSVSLIDDTIVEGDENFTATLSNVSVGNVSFDTSIGTATIKDDDAATLSISNPILVNEQDGFAVFSITFLGTINAGVTVAVTTSDDTANSGDDYTAVNSVVTFSGNDGEVQTINIPIIDDLENESSESFTVTLSSVSNNSVTISNNIGQATIVDNDIANVIVNDVTVSESQTEAIFTVTLGGGDVPGGFTISYSSKNGTASDPQDFVATAGSLSFSGVDGEALQLKVPIVNDNIVEASETFEVMLINSSSTLVTIGDTTGIATIVDDDIANLAIQDITVNEGEAKANFDVVLTGGTVSDSFSVDYATENRIAISGEDYSKKTGTLSFNGTEGEIKTIAVNISEDTLIEGVETFKVVLSNLSSTTVNMGDPIAIGTITDNDFVLLSIADVTIDEDSEMMFFTVTLQGDVPDSFTVTYATINATALSGIDYTETSGSLSFEGKEGENQSFRIPILDDELKEETEHYKIRLKVLNNEFVRMTKDEVIATIIDNDGDIGFEVDDLIISPNPASTILNFKLTQEGNEVVALYVFDPNNNLIIRKTDDLKQLKVDVSTLAQGVYFLEVINKKGKKYVKEFLKR